MRYDPTVQVWSSGADDGASSGQPTWVDGSEVTVSYGTRSANNPDGLTSAVRATNERIKNKWSDGSDYKHNVFNEAIEGGN